MHRAAILVCCWILLASLTASAAPAAAESPIPEAWRAASEAGPWVVRIATDNRPAIVALHDEIDIWHILPEQGSVVALVTEDDVARLGRRGLAMVLDEEQTATLARVGIPRRSPGSGIPGFPCYRTVEETYAAAESIVLAHPELATWIDIGDSWQKVQDASSGYDLRVLRLTRSSIPGPKPVFFASFALHAREYATAELGTRFAEHLVSEYDQDADITWLLDHHEIHLLLQANPDGRKMAEAGLFWRKNANNDYCSNTNSRGADLNRNFDFEWNCCGGSSSSQCSDAYRGPSAASEPEIQAHQDYVRSIFPDQRVPDLTAPAPPTATGVAIDVHSFGNLVLWPWGLTPATAPNATAFATLGRKLAFFNGYQPIKITELTVADGSSADFYYGELGVAGFGYELGTTFFESCDTFEATIVPQNIDSLLYAAKVARTPYQTPAGPEAFDVAAPNLPVAAGELARITAQLDDTRFSQSNGSEPSQTIAVAEVFLDIPPWADGAVAIAMAASDGTFDSSAEAVEVEIDTTDLPAGRHVVYVRGIDADGHIGPVGAAFLTTTEPGSIFGDGFESGNLSRWSAQAP